MRSMQASVTFDHLSGGRGRMRFKSVTGEEIGVEMTPDAISILRSMMERAEEVRPT